MKTKIKKLQIDQHKGWKACWWEGFESKDESVCIIEIEPGKSLNHKHLLKTEHEFEIILDGEATYKGAINGVFHFGDVVEQTGTSDLIKIKNTGDKTLRLICVNRPPWRPEHEEILI